MPEHLNTASRAISAAISSSNQLQQQLRTQTINQPSDQVIRQPANRNSEQMHSLIDNLLQGTYSALRQEFQTTVLYKVSCTAFDHGEKVNLFCCIVASPHKKLFSAQSAMHN